MRRVLYLRVEALERLVVRRLELHTLPENCEARHDA